MKRLFVFLSILSVSVLFHSCDKTEVFDKTLLYGTWRTGTLHYKFVSDYTGSSWDTSDDVGEDDQMFEWQLVKSDLTIIHIGKMGQRVPEYLTVTQLTTTTLRVKDDFNVNITFTKDRR